MVRLPDRTGPDPRGQLIKARCVLTLRLFPSYPLSVGRLFLAILRSSTLKTTRQVAGQVSFLFRQAEVDVTISLLVWPAIGKIRERKTVCEREQPIELVVDSLLASLEE